VGWTEVLNAADIFIGVKRWIIRLSRLSSRFIGAFEQLAMLATKAGVEGTSLSKYTRHC